MVAAFRNWQASHGKPVVFTELATAARTAPPVRPGLGGVRSYDAGEQADCYEAAFQVWSQQASWIAGDPLVELGRVDASANDTGYTPAEARGAGVADLARPLRPPRARGRQ